ncbi:helix-turn-helix transcriptional regulator [bacterium]|nr:helix-turn-helix transcriptional regulator [bacterium]
MTRMKMPDDTMGRVGAIMHNARMSCRMSRDELADMLRILPNELAAYEHGKIKIPADVLEHVFAMGFSMLRFRTLTSKYRMQRRIFRNLKQSSAEMP